MGGANRPPEPYLAGQVPPHSPLDSTPTCANITWGVMFGHFPHPREELGFTKFGRLGAKQYRCWPNLARPAAKIGRFLPKSCPTASLPDLNSSGNVSETGAVVAHPMAQVRDHSSDCGPVFPPRFLRSRLELAHPMEHRASAPDQIPRPLQAPGTLPHLPSRFVGRQWDRPGPRVGAQERASCGFAATGVLMPLCCAPLANTFATEALFFSCGRSIRWRTAGRGPRAEGSATNGGRLCRCIWRRGAGWTGRACGTRAPCDGGS